MLWNDMMCMEFTAAFFISHFASITGTFFYQFRPVIEHPLFVFFFYRNGSAALAVIASAFSVNLSIESKNEKYVSSFAHFSQ